MTENNKPKMKLWKKILIGLAVIFIISRIIAWGNAPAISADEVNKIISENNTLEEENKKLKEENKKLKENYDAALSTVKMYAGNELEKEKQAKATQDTKPVAKEEQKNTNPESVPREYQNALKMAKTYADTIPLSKKRLFEQLTSEHGSKYPQEAAQYAIDNLKIDYKQQALKSAKNYMDTIPLSDSELFEQLTSEHGEGFTEEEAQYAIDNLDK